MFMPRFSKGTLTLCCLILTSLFVPSFGHADLPSDPESTPKEKNLCQTPFDKGNKISPPAIPYKIITTVFGKRYNESYLNVLLDASGEETVNFIKKHMKVDVYVVTPSSNNSGDKCLVDQKPYFNSVTKAPDEFQKIWKETEDYILSADDKATILGQFLTGSATRNPTILLHDHSAGRMALVHEAFHALFDLQRRTDNQAYELDLLGREYAATEDKTRQSLRRFAGDLNLKTLESSIVALSAQIKALNKILKATSLEEFLIEKIFFKYRNNGQLKNVDDYIRQDSLNYMLVNLQNAGIEMTHFDGLLANLCKITIEADPEEKADDQVNKERLQSIQTTCKSTASETRNFILATATEHIKLLPEITPQDQDQKEESKPIALEKHAHRHPKATDILKKVRQGREVLTELIHHLPK